MSFFLKANGFFKICKKLFAKGGKKTFASGRFGFSFAEKGFYFCFGDELCDMLLWKNMENSANIKPEAMKNVRDY